MMRSHGRARRLLAIALIGCSGTLVGIGTAASPVAAAPSDLDPSFGSDGSVTANLSSDTHTQTIARDVAVAPDGKIVAAGTDLVTLNGAESDFVVERRTADGSLDPGFGTDGVAVADFGPATVDQVNGVAVQTDGSVVVAGVTFPVTDSRLSKIAVARFDADGVLDPTFGAGGLATVTYGTTNAFKQATAVAIDSAGRVALGVSGPPVTGTAPNPYTAIRLTPAGILDSTFSDDGIAQVAGGITYTLAVGAGDTVLVAGRNNANPRRTEFVRFTSTGSPDTTFGTGGKFTDSIELCGQLGRNGCALAVDAGGRPLIAGGSGAAAIVQRLNANGTRDMTFGVSSVATLDFGAPVASAADLALDAAGRIVVAGLATDVERTYQDVGVARLDADGTLDPAFDGDGETAFDLTGNPDTAVGVALDAGGNAVVASLDDPPGQAQRGGLARLSASDGAIDPGFGGDGRVVTGVERSYPSYDAAHDVATDASDRVVAVGITSDGGDSSSASVARFLTDGTLDPTFGTAGSVLTLGPDPIFEWTTVAIDARGRIVTAGRSCDPNVGCSTVVGRFTDTGALDPTFAGDGIAELPDVWGDRPGLALDSRGRPLVAGGPTNEKLLRLTVTGIPDPTFAGGVPIVSPQSASGLRSIAVDGLDRVVVSGTATGGAWEVARYDAAGSPDPTFGTTGTVSFDVTPLDPPNIYDQAVGTAIDPSGRILVAGADGTFSDVLVARLDDSGALDPSFGTQGIGRMDVPGSYLQAQGVTLDRHGRAVLAVRTGERPWGISVLRFTASGVPDVGFGTAGLHVLSSGLYSDLPGGVAVDTQGRIVEGGGAGTVNEVSDYSVFRLVGDPAPPDTTAPTAVIEGPADGSTFDFGATITARYSCADDFGGIGVDTCTGSVADGALVDTTTVGAHTFSVVATDLLGNSSTTTSSYTVRDGASGSVGGGGGSVSTGGTPTADDPVETTVTIPAAGTISISESPTSTPAPSGYALAGHQVSITAPSSTPADPLTLVFRLDATMLADAGMTPSTVQVFRNGVVVQSCSAPTTPVAEPDPCVFARTALAGGDAEISVYTSAASEWNFGRLLVPPEIVPGSATVTEGNTGTTVLSIPVTLSAPSTLPVSASWVSANNTAVAPGDYTAGSGTITFAPGATSASVAISVKGDKLVETDELMLIAVSNPTNATIGGYYGLGFAAILNDDVPVVVPGSATVVEGNSGTKTMNIPVTLSAASPVVVSVQWTTAANTATAPSDFTAASGTLSFAPGQTTKTIPVVVKGDTTIEPDELVLIALSNPTNATIGGYYGLGFGAIQDDDRPGLSVNDVSVAEGNSGTKTMTFTVRLSKAATAAVTVTYATANGTAVSPSDYQARSGTVTFAAGTTSRTFTVPIVGDTVREPHETFAVNLSGASSNARIVDATGIGTITNND